MDPYIDPESGVLRNKLGITDKAGLARAEAGLSHWRTMQLLVTPLPRTADLAELQALHHHLFQDVYDWAGQVRIVDLEKDHSDAEPFLPCEAIPTAAGFLAVRLSQDRHLKGLGRTEFVERLTDYYEELNYIHPFREGNGRTQRLFWSRVAHEAGWILDWATVSGAENDRACRAANDQADKRQLRGLLDRITRPREPAKKEPSMSDWEAIITQGIDFGYPDIGPGHQLS